MNRSIKIAIRELVDFCCRGGDLGSQDGPPVKALDGIRAHQKVQHRYKTQASAEQKLQYQTRLDNTDIELSGRVDLLFADETPPRLEEIKTVQRFKQDLFANHNETHWAQVKCYAACYAIDQQLGEVSVSVNYVDLLDYRENRQTKIFTRAELEAFLQQTLLIYINWQQLLAKQIEATINSAQLLAFPFPEFRSQQRQFATEVYRTIQKGSRLLVEAPTGSGKTISTLFPSVKAIGEDLADQIIFLSAKTSGQNEARKAIDLMIGKGLSISYLVIKAKAKCCKCVLDDSELDPNGNCGRCIGFFDRLPAAREALLRKKTLSTEMLEKVANEFQLCPFELSLQMLPWVDVIICDFNYIFDPLVQLSYFRTDDRRKILLIDEMHNLVDRARGMYSASINRSQVQNALQANNSVSVNHEIERVANVLERCFRDQSEAEFVSDEVPRALTRVTNNFGDRISNEIFDNKRIDAVTLDLAKAIFRFQSICELYDEHHKVIRKKPIQQREIELLCLNAFEYLEQIYPLFYAVCGFSATLNPASYFLPACGLKKNSKAITLTSSFPLENLQVNVCSYIDTRYQQRNSQIEHICDCIYSCYQARSGNYLVFFSSYQFMQKVQDYFVQKYLDIETVTQQRGSDDKQRLEFLSKFFERQNILGFAIMGGIFAEGIDYIGSALIGAIIVGVGLPQASTEQQLIQKDFEAMELDGFDYAFRFPGLTRVQQSAGRVIRSERDCGIVVLIDRRFQQVGYRTHFPAHWETQHCNNLEALEQSLKAFWNSS